MEPKLIASPLLVGLTLSLAAILPARAFDLQRGDQNDSDGAGNIWVDVGVDMTEAGRKIVHPTPDHPVYYWPVPAGYKAYGEAPYFQHPPPTPAEVQALFGKELARQGYLITDKQHRPSLILVFRWGYIDPGIDYHMKEIVPLMAMLQGRPPPFIHPPNPWMDLHEMMLHGHWYILVLAFDFDDWAQHHKPTMYWRARITTTLWGHYFAEVLPAMAATAGPMFGYETTQPRYVPAPVVPLGRVIVGRAEEVPSAPAVPGKDGQP